MRRNSSFRRRSSGASANRTRRSSVAFREQVLGSPSLPVPIQKMLDGIERQLGIRDWSLSTLAAVALSRRAWMIPVLFVLLAGFVIAAGGGGGTVETNFPIALEDYNDPEGGGIGSILASRIAESPFNLVGSLVFLLAICHTFAAAPITEKAHHIKHHHEEELRKAGKSEEFIKNSPSFKAELFHFIGEIEAIFGIWVIALMVAIIGFYDWSTFKDYIAHTVVYIEPMFVVVIMAIASTRPIVKLAEQIMGRVAAFGQSTTQAWWFSILTLAPLLGSFITEPAAMTIAALLLAKQFYDYNPSPKFAYATIGLLFVNVSVGGTLTHFAAPPVLMVAAPWGWDIAFMMVNFGWKAVIGVVIANILYYIIFKNEFANLKKSDSSESSETNAPAKWEDREDPIPGWVTVTHLLFMAWTVFNAHYPPLFIGGFLFFIGFTMASKAYQNKLEIKGPLLVGFFLAGLVTHGGVQAWWIAPVLQSLSELPLMIGSTVLTAFNDNAAITFLATLVPGFTDGQKYAVVAGAVTGGGLTVIANAPNPAGQSILSRYFPGGVNPANLAMGAAIPTVIMGVSYMGFYYLLG
ncbi:MAG: hypothetical protein HN867_16925 [Deltaproteobacteria bacterium]|jgi:hypothetical protein|nr:hypothetical protein [Deltaproteobacteria bacterium]MBT7205145.1 hypothetical protein [Deltaproteobacteria bacterium]